MDQPRIEISDHNLCLECGNCCKAFGLSKASGDGGVVEAVHNSGDERLIKWFNEDIIYIGLEQAKGIIRQEELDTEKYKVGTIYSCTLLDGDGRCRDYANRPQICREFPSSIRELPEIELGDPVHHYVDCRLGDAVMADEVLRRAATDGSIKVVTDVAP